MTKNIVSILILAVVILSPQTSAFNFTVARIADIHGAIRQGYVSCHDIVQGYLDRIKLFGMSSNSGIGAIIAVNPNALKEADALDAFFKANNGKLKGRLHCVPLVAKDSIDVAGLPTTNGLDAFKNQIPLKDAEVVKNCKAQGAIFLAKANMSPLSDKEAWGNSETGGLIRNPYAQNYTTYGSSGGNAAAAGSALAIGGIGTETGVSINLPSSTSDIVGIRPPVDLLESVKGRDGVMPNSKFQDVVGPMARYAEDAVAILDGMLGREGKFASSVLDPLGLADLKFNIFELMTYGTFSLGPGMDYVVDPKIQQLFSAAANQLKSAGAQVQNVSINFGAAAPFIMNMFGIGYSSCVPGWRDAYLGDPQRFNSDAFNSFDEVVAAKKLPAYYQANWESLKSQAAIPGQCDKDTATFKAAVSALITNAIDPLLAGADVAIWPVLPVFPAKLGEDAFAKNWGSATQAPINLVLLASWSGYASATVQLGYSDPLPDAPQGLPIGMHLLAKPEKFPQLLKAIYGYQSKFATFKYPKISIQAGCNQPPHPPPAAPSHPIIAALAPIIPALKPFVAAVPTIPAIPALPAFPAFQGFRF